MARHQTNSRSIPWKSPREQQLRQMTVVSSGACFYSTGWGRRICSSACRASSSYPAAIRSISRLTRGSIMVVAWRRTSSARPSQYSASKPLDGTSSPGLPKSRVRNANAGVMFHTVTTNTTQVFVGRGKYIYIRLGATQLQAVVVPGGLATLGWAILLSQTQVDNATKSPLKHSASTALSIVQEQP